MKQNHSVRQLLLIAVSMTIFFPAGAVTAADQGSAEKEIQASMADQKVNIDCNETDIRAFIKSISKITGRNFVVDNKVKGKVTVISPSDVTVDEAYSVFESVLEVHGYTTVVSGEITKVVPSTSARAKSVETLLREDAVSPEDKVVTQLIPLRYADASEIKRLFTPMISRSSVMIAYPATNMLIITDVFSNIKRIMKIIKAIDVSGIGREIKVIQVQNGDALKLVKILNSVFKQTTKSKKTTVETRSKFVADERTNSIIILASEVDTMRVEKLVSILDKEAPRDKGNFHVCYLEHAIAEDLAKVLQSLTSKQGTAAKGKKIPVVSENVKIEADKATNSLIIMADKDDYQTLYDIIRQLDIRRAMVYIECVIMEVGLDKSFNLGVEWTMGEDVTIGGSDGAVGGGFSGNTVAPYQNLSGIAGAATEGVSTLPAGFSVGVFTEPIKIGDVTFPNLGAIVQASKTDQDIHILSTPTITTTDNEEAKMTVGENIPYLVKESSGDTEYQNYEYKDVGITLDITPQISKDGHVRLKINQSITKLAQESETGTVLPKTLKRAFETTVVVKDKNTVVIGGLISDSFSNTTYKVPCLGDIPGIKYLFQTLDKTRDKTNLYVFLTPHVIQTAEDVKELYDIKKSEADKVDVERIKLYRQEQQAREEAALIDESNESAGNVPDAESEAEAPEAETENQSGAETEPAPARDDVHNE